eukprot:UN06528
MITIFIAIFIPVVSSVLPIRRALGTTILTALDQTRASVDAIKITVERTQAKTISTQLLIVGLILFSYGCAIYFLLPTYLLHQNLSGVSYCLLTILLGLLFGLVTIALNFQPLLEMLLVRLLLFWEQRPIPDIVLKNLMAHRDRNLKTSVMYSLALAILMLVLTAYRMELRTAEYEMYQIHAADLVLGGSSRFVIQRDIMDKFIRICDRNPDVNGWTWTTLKISDVFGECVPNAANLGQVFSQTMKIRAVATNFYDVVDNQFLVVDKSRKIDLSFSEQLHSAGGSQELLMGSYFSSELALSDLEDIFLLRNKDVIGGKRMGYNFLRVKPLAFLGSSPSYHISRYSISDSENQDVLVSAPSFLRYGNALCTDEKLNSIEDIPINAFYIRMRDGTGDVSIDSLKAQLSQLTKSIWDRRQHRSSLSETKQSMQFIFMGAAFVAMTLCLFSLIASMFTNVREQRGEIAVLRSIGMT